MTTYIDENKFRNCEINNLSKPPAFNKGNPPSLNSGYSIDSSILKRLAINDTFHDFSKERDGYDKSAFNYYGPANYLLTGEWFEGDFINNYKNLINFNEYNEIKSSSFEANVTNLIEINAGLQNSDISVTFDEILNGFDNSDVISPSLREKLVLSNGSITLCINKNNPKISKFDGKNITFSQYLLAISDNKENILNQNYLKIANFIRWYLHSVDLIDFSSLKTLNKITLPDVAMKILSDASIGFLADIFRVPGSKTTPFIAVPCFLDSASTSTSILDPDVPFFFEKLTSDYIVPIVSNYFSCDEYFMCYLLNENSSFDKDNLFNFSLVIFKIPELQQVKSAIEYIRNSPALDENYYRACNIVKEQYIDAFPGLIARYYFGEVQKQKGRNSDENDNLNCGTCGAGIPYIGKLMGKLLKLQKDIDYNSVSGLWLSKTGPVSGIKNIFNDLKKEAQLNSRIPIADSRILKLFCYTNRDGQIFMNMTKDDSLSLFKILVDYKRTGDYQQSYTVLKQILQETTNANCYTFSSVDELSTLVARLLGVPSIFHVGKLGICKLFRCNVYSADPQQQQLLKIKNDINIINNYIDKIKYKLVRTCFFITSYYEKICILRQQLLEQINRLSVNMELTSAFLYMKYANAIDILSILLKACNDFLGITESDLGQFFTQLTQLNSDFQIINNNFTQSVESLNQNELSNISSQLQPIIQQISVLEDTKNFAVYNAVIEQNFTLALEDTTTIFDPLKEQELLKLTFRRPSLGLALRAGKDVSNETKNIIKYIVNKQQNITPSRESLRIAEKRKQLEEMANKQFVSQINNFIDSFSSSILNDGLADEFRIDIAEKFFENDYVNRLTSTINQKMYQNIQNIGCSQEYMRSIVTNLNVILQQFGVSCSFERPAGDKVNSEIYQVGGIIQSVQDYNKYCLYYEIQKIILKTLNKCSVYMSNVIQNIETLGDNNIASLLLFLANEYETDSFCNQLLFEQNDEYDFDDENIGLLTSLNMLAEQYTYSDIYDQNDQEIIQNPAIADELLTVNDMLSKLNLPYIYLIITLLSWSDPNLSELAFLFMKTPSITLETPSMTLESFLDNFPSYKILYKNLQKTNMLSIFSIMSLGVLNYVYYGTNSPCFIPEICSTYLQLSGGRNGLVHFNYSPNHFLLNILQPNLDTIYTSLYTKITQDAVATGPGLGRGIRNKNNRQIYNPISGRGGYKQNKTIRHKTIKRKNIKNKHKKTKPNKNKKFITKKGLKTKKKLITIKNKNKES
jgi:hypothetical protein